MKRDAPDDDEVIDLQYSSDDAPPAKPPAKKAGKAKQAAPAKQGGKAKQAEPPKPLKSGTLSGKAVATCAGPLIYEEDEDNAYYLNSSELKKIVGANGGKFQAAINSKTNIVVKGDLSKEYTAKEADTWNGSKKQLELATQQSAATANTRKEKLEVLDFRNFVHRYSLIDDVEPELLWSFFSRRSPDSFPLVSPEGGVKRGKNAYGIGSTCIWSEHMRAAGHTGYRKGAYLDHKRICDLRDKCGYDDCDNDYE
jgi:hypothetical protein